MNTFTNYLYLVLGKGVSYIIPLLVLPVYANSLGREEFGTLALYQSLALWLSIFIEYGFSLSGPKSMARNSHSKIFSDITSAKIGLAILVFIFTSIISLFLNKDNLLLITATTILGCSQGMSVIWFYQGKGILGRASLVDLLFRLLGIGLPALFILRYPRVELIIISQMIFCIIGNFFLYTNILKKFGMRFKLSSATRVIKILKDDINLFTFRFVTSFYTTLNPVFISLILGSYQVALFSVVDRLVRAGVSFVLPLSQAMYPRSNEVVVNLSGNDVRRYYLKSLMICIGLALAAYLGLVIVGKFFIEWFFGEEFHEASKFLPLFGVFIMLVALNNFIGIQLLVPFSLESHLTRSTLLGAVVNISIIYPLCINYDMYGAIFSILLSELAVLIYMVVFVVLNRGHIFTNVNEV